jgi:ABC-type transport system involved in multi-copper enzyme maturation permease subunit
LLLVTVALASSALVLLRWPSDALVDLEGHQSRHVFRLFGYGMLATVLLLTPVFPASSIVREKNEGTLALLLNSPLSSLSLYLGKLLGSLGFLALVLATSIPAAAALTGMGGISFSREIVVLYFLLAVATVQFTAIALLVSTYASSSESAMRWTYAWTLILSVLVLAPFLFLQGRGDIAELVSERLRCLSPIPAVMELMGHSAVGSQGFLSQGSAALGYLVLTPFAILWCAAFTISRLNYRIFDRARSQGIMTHERSESEQWARRLFFLVDPQRRRGGIPWLVNPVMVKEFRCRRFGRAHWMLRLAAICALVSLLLTLASTLSTIQRGVEYIGTIMVVLQVALVVLLTPSMAATLISGEVESGGWVLLKMTPLSSTRILVGKLMSVLWTMLLILISTIPGYLVMVWIDPDRWNQIRQILICLLWTVAFSLAVSATVSSFFRRTSLSTSIAYIVLLTVYAGTIWCGWPVMLPSGMIRFRRPCGSIQWLRR